MSEQTTMLNWLERVRLSLAGSLVGVAAVGAFDQHTPAYDLAAAVIGFACVFVALRSILTPTDTQEKT